MNRSSTGVSPNDLKLGNENHKSLKFFKCSTFFNRRLTAPRHGENDSTAEAIVDYSRRGQSSSPLFLALGTSFLPVALVR